MKTQLNAKLLLTLIGGLLFNYLFWKENLGINLLLHSILIFVALRLDRQIVHSKKAFIFGIAHLFAAILVVCNNSILSIFSYYISLLVWIGFTHAQYIRSVCFAGVAGFLQIICAPYQLCSSLMKISIGKFSIAPLIKPIKYILLPIAILLIFSVVYSNANPLFDQYMEGFLTTITQYIYNVLIFLFKNLDLDRLFHIFLGILFSAVLLLAFKNNLIQTIELTLTTKLIRSRKPSTKIGVLFKALLASTGWIKKMALKTENITAIICFSALNLQILFLNAIDLSTLWLGNTGEKLAKDYSENLHDGTIALIFSIVLAMIVILYFFSGNLNFYRKNKAVRVLSYIWMLQNAFLVLSVCLRDFQYIELLGLTYKRIGVLVFLFLCSAGLVTVYLKVAQQKTFFYLCKINGLIWYIVLVTLSMINWDPFIANYQINYSKSDRIDLSHLLDLSDKTLPLLDQNRSLLQDYFHPANLKLDPTTASTTVIDTAQLQQQLAIKQFNQTIDLSIEKFKKEWEKTSWLSWNYQDWQTYKYFTKNGELTSK